MKVKAIRPFYLEGEVVKAGEVVEVDDSVGRGLLAANKAEPVRGRRKATAEPDERATGPQEQR